MIMHTVIYIHTHAPSKPSLKEACNGCGVCCTAELCPLAQLRYWRRQGPCPALEWKEDERRYRCGMLTKARNRWLQRWIYRSISAGQGCDSSAEVKEFHLQEL